MMKRLLNIITLFVILFARPNTALAQDYYFRLDTEVVHVIFNENGTISLDYTLEFYNDPSGHSIEFVDLGLPNYSFNTNNIQAQINGEPVRLYF